MRVFHFRSLRYLCQHITIFVQLYSRILLTLCGCIFGALICRWFKIDKGVIYSILTRRYTKCLFTNKWWPPRATMHWPIISIRSCVGHNARSTDELRLDVTRCSLALNRCVWWNNKWPKWKQFYRDTKVWQRETTTICNCNNSNWRAIEIIRKVIALDNE